MKGIGFLWGTPIQIPNHQVPKPFVDWIPEVSVAPKPPHCSLSLHCVVLESVIFHNIKARKSSLEALGRRRPGIGRSGRRCGVKS